MSNYKVVDADQLDADLTAVADRIRARNGTDANLEFPQEYIDGIDAIKTPLHECYFGVSENGLFVVNAAEGIGFNRVKVDVNVPIPEGYIKPSGTLDITENGEYDVAEFEKVNVASGGEDLTKYLEERYEEVILPNIKKVKANAFYIDITMKSLSIPNVTQIDSRAFYDCRNLVSVSMPNVTSIALEAFYLCNSIVSIVLPSSLVSTGHYTFGNCSGLKTVTFKGIPTRLNVLTFGASPNLTTINVPWASGAVAGAPWGATNATINYNYTGE
jgi:hypothetical protein